MLPQLVHIHSNQNPLKPIDIVSSKSVRFGPCWRVASYWVYDFQTCSDEYGRHAWEGLNSKQGIHINLRAGVDLLRTGVVAVLEGLLGGRENREGACCLERRLSSLSTCFITFSVSFIRACIIVEAHDSNS